MLKKQHTRRHDMNDMIDTLTAPTWQMVGPDETGAARKVVQLDARCLGTSSRTCGRCGIFARGVASRTLSCLSGLVGVCVMRPSVESPCQPEICTSIINQTSSQFDWD